MGQQMLQLLGPEFIPNHNKCLREKKMRLLVDWWVIHPVFGYFVGGLASLWVFCGWFGWFEGVLRVV